MASPPLWLIGSLISVLGSITSNLGVNIQKYSAMQEEKRTELYRTYCHQPLWILGFCFVSIGAICDFAALAFAAQSIVATVGSLSLVANIFFAHFWLKEELSHRDILATIMIVVGATLSVAFGDQSNVSYTLDDLVSFYSKLAFLIYIGITGTIAMMLYIVIRRCEPLLKGLNVAKKRHTEFCSEKQFDSARNTLRLIERQDAIYEPYKDIHPIAYCALAGWFGSMVLLFAKSTGELIRKSVDGDNQFLSPLTYIFIVSMIACIVIETHFLATALRYFDALYVVPVFQCFFVTLGACTGGIYFGEFSSFSLLQAILFPTGFCITLCGVYILSSREMTHAEFEDISGHDSVVLTEPTLSDIDDEQRDLVPELPKNSKWRRKSIESVDMFGKKQHQTMVSSRCSLRDASRRLSFSAGSLIFSQFSDMLVNSREVDKIHIAEIVYLRRKHKRSHSITTGDLAKFKKQLSSESPRNNVPINANTTPLPMRATSQSHASILLPRAKSSMPNVIEDNE